MQGDTIECIHLVLMHGPLRFAHIRNFIKICMTHNDAKDDFKDALDNTKEAASDAASGVKKTAEGVGEEVREIVDEEEK